MMKHAQASFEQLAPLLVRSSFDHAIFMIDVEGRIASWNPGAEMIFGWSGEVVGKPFATLFTPEEQEAGVAESELRRAEKNGRADDRRWHARKDGSRFFAEGVTVALRDDDGTLLGYGKISTDITLWKLTEIEHVAQNATLHILSRNSMIEEAAPELLSTVSTHLDWEFAQLWIVDQSIRRLRCVNTWSAPKYALPPKKLCGDHRIELGAGIPGKVWQSKEPVWIEDLSDFEKLPRHEAFTELGITAALAFPIVMNDQVEGVLEFFSRHPRKPDPHVLRTLQTIGAQLGLFIERRIAEDALRDNEERYRVLAETASDAMVTIDETSTITYANAAVTRIFGHMPEELQGKKLHTLIPERLRAAHDVGIRRYMATHQKNIPWAGVELPGLHRDGQEIPLEISFGEYEKDGERFFTGIMRDVSERKRYDEERSRLILESQEANRSKDEFLATVSHELRTPMTAVLGWTRVLKMGADEETVKEAVAAIERSATAQAQLIDDILDVSRITMGKLRFRAEPVRLAEVIDAAIDTVHIAADARGVELTKELPQDLPLVLGDASRLQQVFWNLLSNAIKFTHEGGSVSVTVKRVGNDAEIRIRDTGEGMSREFLPHVFERFRQAEGSSRRAHGGLGLGLAIVKHLVELHGGTVAADSEGPGKGSTFTVKLPLARDVQEVGETTMTHRLRRRREDELTSLEGVDVILLEDDRETRVVLTRLLKTAGATVRDFHNVDDAIRAIEESMPDVVVSDLAMPGRNGYDLIEHVRASDEKREKYLPVVAVTASGAAGDRERALQAGFDCYLRKPVEPGEFIDVVAELAVRPGT